MSAPPDGGGDAKKEKGPASSLIELVVIVAVALGLALGIQAFLVKPYRIPSESMVPTLVEGQRVLVNRIGDRFSDPKVGDVVVFHPPRDATSQVCGGSIVRDSMCSKPQAERSSETFIKRLVAGPGDKVAMVDGHAVVNGKRQKDGYITPCDGASDCSFSRAITVPPDHYFMMGDNRGASDDSRFWGPVPREWIIGVAFATYWPPKKIGTL